jgi:hypothetical protein
MKGASFVVWLVKPSCKRSSIVGCDVEVPPRARESTPATNAREVGGEIFTRKILYMESKIHISFSPTFTYSVWWLGLHFALFTWNLKALSVLFYPPVGLHRCRYIWDQRLLPFHTSRKIILSWRLFNETFHILSYISFRSIVSSSDLSSLITLDSLVFLCFYY